MNLLERMLPGATWDPGLLARMLPGTAPDPVVSAAASIPVEDGVGFVPVPGPRGLPGEVAGSLPWSNITDRPETFAPTSYTHTQAQASNLWTIAHNLGYHPTVRACTVGGLVFEAEELHLSLNVLELRLAVPFAGTARLI